MSKAVVLWGRLGIGWTAIGEISITPFSFGLLLCSVQETVRFGGSKSAVLDMTESQRFDTSDGWVQHQVLLEIVPSGHDA